MSITHSIAKTKLVEGVGVNDANYVVQPIVNGKKVCCYFYRSWHDVLSRCYSDKFKSRNPAYLDCKLCDEWHSFMEFRAWMQTQDWEGKQLDKDLIGNGKLYSPDNCVFVSQALNNLLTDCGAMRGEHPIGVCWHKEKRKFMAAIRVNGKRKYLGYFTSPDDAHAAWYNAKLEIVKGFLDNETNPRVRYAIECGIAKLQCKYMIALTDGASK